MPFAIRSILAQSYPNFEIIVSDNFSSDNTPEVAQGFGDSRILYVRTSKSLSMSESYRFALSHASGEYVTFLSDDDSFTINLLEKAKSITDETKTELLCWKHAYYYLNEYKSEERPFYHPLRRIEKNSLVVPTFSSQLFEIDSLLLLKRALLNDPAQPESLLAPEAHGALFTNAVYHRSLLNRIKECGLDLFRKNVIPDIYAAFIAGLLAKRYFFLDEPLTVFCMHGSSATANYAAEKTSLADKFEEAPGREHELLTPIKSFLNRNYYLNSVLQAQQEVGHNGEGVELNRKRYYLMYHAEMISCRERGIDISEESSEFDAVLSREPESLQEEVRSAIAINRRAILRKAIRNLPRPSLLTKMAVRLSPGSIYHQSILVNGEDVGFRDIAECGAWLDNDRLKQLSDFCLSIFQGRAASLPFKWQIG